MAIEDSALVDVLVPQVRLRRVPQEIRPLSGALRPDAKQEELAPMRRLSPAPVPGQDLPGGIRRVGDGLEIPAASDGRSPTRPDHRGSRHGKTGEQCAGRSSYRPQSSVLGRVPAAEHPVHRERNDGESADHERDRDARPEKLHDASFLMNSIVVQSSGRHIGERPHLASVRTPRMAGHFEAAGCHFHIKPGSRHCRSTGFITKYYGSCGRKPATKAQ